jgi:NitT/TauT family transport system permease protein
MSTVTASAAPGVAGPRARAARRVRAGRRGLSGVVVFVALAELASRTGLINPAALPPISEVLVEAARLLVDGAFLAEVRATVVAAGTGLAAATLVAVPAGLLLGSFRLANQAASAVVEFLRPIPPSLSFPLAILVYGQGAQMKIALVVYACLWPIFFNTVYGVRDVEPCGEGDGAGLPHLGAAEW